MKASKYLASTVAAVTVVGAIGFAYAQSNTYDSSRSTGATQAQNQTPSTTASDPSMQNQPQSGTTDGTRTLSPNTRDMSGERMARADRN